MSMTKYMHPRNIYKTPPNFKQLAIDYPEFRKFVKQELTGKVSLDFKNIEALRSLTCTLLKKDFDLDVEIPLTKLIPTIPLRLNYILWIEDLIEISRTPENESNAIQGIDIGTGASCVYPLLAARKNHWNMLATDIDDETLQYAKQNVARNQLDNYIEVIKSSKDTLLLHAETMKEFDFCMCNPPFFSSHQDTIFTFKSRKESRSLPKNAFCAAPQEVVAQGGEVEFITKMIHESQQLQTKIKIYTTMIGHASSLSPLKQLLRKNDVVSFKQTEFCQGNTTRWGLAWTFCDIDLRKVPETTLAAQRKLKLQQKNAFQYQITSVPQHFTLDDIHNKMLEVFSELRFNYKIIHAKTLITYEIESASNTWSHQRRKRRAAQRAANTLNGSDESKTILEDTSNNANDSFECEEPKNGVNSHVDSTTEMISRMQMKSPKKRELDDDEGYYNSKRFKSDDKSEEIIRESLYLSAKILLFKDKENVNIELSWNHANGEEKKDVLHQVLQYLKNNLKL